MSRFAQINAFINVVDTKSFAKAATKLGVSTAAISRHVSKLEAGLKVQLLQRSTRMVELTQIGAEYYHQVKETMAQLREAELAIGAYRTEATGLLHVATGRYFASEYILPKLVEFMQHNPKLQVKIELFERQCDFLEEPFDIVFGSSLAQADYIVQRRIGSTRFVLCASPNYLKKFGNPDKPTDLLKHRYVTHSGRTPDNIITFSHHEPVKVRPILWLNESHTIRDCVINHMGIAKLHHYIVREALQTGDLVEVLPKYAEAEKPVYLYYRSSRYLQSKIRRFIDFFTQ